MEEQKMSFVLLGLSGAGKSTFTNKILSKMEAEESSSTKSCTTQCSIYQYKGKLNNKETDITVIDTPGSNDTEGRTESMINSISTFLRPHKISAVLLVVKAEKITLLNQLIIDVYGALIENVPDENVGIVVTHTDVEGLEKYPDHPRVKKQLEDKKIAIQDIQKTVIQKTGKCVVKILASQAFLDDQLVRDWLNTCFGSVKQFDGSVIRGIQNLVSHYKSIKQSYEKKDKSSMIQVLQKQLKDLNSTKVLLTLKAGTLGTTSAGTYIGGFAFPPLWIASLITYIGTVSYAQAIEDLNEEIAGVETEIEFLSKQQHNFTPSKEMIEKYEKAKKNLEAIEQLLLGPKKIL